MAKVVDGVVFLRKGDTEELTVTASVGEEAYEFEVGDVVTLTVRELPSGESPVLLTDSVTVEEDTEEVEMSFTTDLEVGAYSMDVQLRMADGTVKTLFPAVDTESPKNKVKNWKNCIVEGEVTVDGDD